MIQAVVFDMDGIMFDTEHYSSIAMREVGEKLGMPGMDEYAVEVLGANAQSVRDNFARRYGHMMSSEEFWSAVREHRKANGEDESIPVKTGLYELLDYLKENGYKIAVATSTAQPKVLQNFEITGINGRFDAIVCGDMIEKSKPEPDIYLKAAEMLGLDPAACLALEDSPNGLRSAKSAGMYTVMVPDMIPATEELLRVADKKVDTLLDVMPLLEELSRPACNC